MKLALLAAAAAVAIASPASAYWEFGHQTIARIAMANVTPRTAEAVKALLRHSAVLDTPQCPAATPEQASTWADCVKPIKNGDNSNRFAYAYGWHFQDVEICEPFEASLAAACKDGNCVSAQIEKDVAILKDGHASERDRVQALVYLIHFVGDLHQPLHAGEKHDAGGNKVAASYAGYEPPHFNLHSIWDGPLAERAISTGPTLIRRFPDDEREAIAAGSVTDWSRESWQVAHDSVYASIEPGGDACAPSPAKAVLDADTIDKLVPVARLQVERGGLRLAKLLDEALG